MEQGLWVEKVLTLDDKKVFALPSSAYNAAMNLNRKADDNCLYKYTSIICINILEFATIIV